MHRDGDGWVECERGHRHWGRHGAAGLLLHAVDDTGGLRVLLQHRAPWSHHGDTWALPGGALDSHEQAIEAALREAGEEARLDRAMVNPRHTFVDDHGGWSYTTVYADTPAPLPTTPEAESVALAWVRVEDVAERSLHPGFAATWTHVRVPPTVVLVDTANVLGSRPDRWWRDRARATTRLLEHLAGLRGVTVSMAAGRPQVIAGVVAVLEGAAQAAIEPGWIEVVRSGDRAGVNGDDALVATASRLIARGRGVTAVTADRALADRLESLVGRSNEVLHTLHTVGPKWLLDVLGANGGDRGARRSSGS